MTVKSRTTKAAILYFVIHMMNEVVCYFMLYRIFKDPVFITMVALVYNCVAFVPQFFWGALRDLFAKFRPGIFSVPLLLSGFLLFFTAGAEGALFWVSLILLSTGNAMIHVAGAELTVRTSGGRLTPVAVFVSGGSFGVILGQVLASTDMSFWWIAVICACMMPLVIVGEKLYKDNPEEADGCMGFDHVISGRNAVIVALAAFFIVAVRSYIGYGIPMAWKKTLVETVLLYVFMGIGKALGGILSDRIGIRRTAFISIIGALPFLVLGNRMMIVSLIGITFFSMTTAVTLGMVISVIKVAPGAAFGITTVALFMGSVISWFVRSGSLTVNVLILVITSAVCFLLSLYILKPEKEVT